MDRLVESVPNFSEGRKADTIRALVATVRSVRGVYLLDEEMDADHHRAVLTFVGAPDSIAEAAFQAARTAAALIDLRAHQGGHPRVGALDVVPFVPIKNVTMEDCIALARSVGERIGRELSIPVFLYERAAVQPARASLESIRRGSLAGLAERMAADSAWVPDFGPRMLHPTAGATIVGARPPLIAYNVSLQTQDLAVAKAIAKTIRASSGGIPHLKAIGVDLPSRRLTQVSMNLTNFEETPIHAAFEAVKKEAERRGVQVVSSELVGLVPQQALIAVSEFFLKLERFDPNQVLETRLEMVLSREASFQEWGSSVKDFVEAVSAGTPTPAGGSVAALAGALAAALGLMVCRIRPPGAQVSPASAPGPPQPTGEQLQAAERRLKTLAERLQALIQADADAYAEVIRAYRLPKSDASRPEMIAASLRVATEVPLETASLASEAAEILRTLKPLVKPSVGSDLKVGLLMARAALEGALENVAVNVKGMKNQHLVNSIESKKRSLQQSLVELKSL